MAKTLEELRQEAAAVKTLESKLRELQDQARHYEREVISLKVAYGEECADIEKLEGRSLANYFYQVIGKLDGKLDRERKEAYEARVKLDAAELELEQIRRERSDVQSQLAEARTAAYLLEQELRRRQEALRHSGSETGKQILAIEQKSAELEARKKEIREAVSAGRSAASLCDRILGELDSADGWNTWDLIGGGGIITHIAKHSHLDEAQDLVSELQDRLRRFKTELADIRIHVTAQVNVEGFLRFADYFFDGLFADFAMRERIGRSQGSVSNTKSQISRVLDQLREMEKATDRELAQLKEQLEALLAQA